MPIRHYAASVVGLTAMVGGVALRLDAVIPALVSAYLFGSVTIRV